MYEDQTYETILNRTLERVATDVDKREGSVIMNAVAPVSAEHTNIYIELDTIIQNGYADTAVREFLIKRCKERGIYPDEATKAILKGEFNMEVPIGSRFSLDELNYKAIAFINSADGFYYYQMECETYGIEGNKYFGELSSIEFINKDLEGKLVELLIPAEDEEDTEHLRTKYLSSFESNPYGGNKQDYKDKTNAQNGVGGTKVIPVWDGGGTVKLIIIDSDFNKASDVLVSAVQEAMDPLGEQGQGVGIAPIGHIVTVVTVREVPIEITARLTFNEGYVWENIKPHAEEAIRAYLLEMRKVWQDESLAVRISQIENRILNLDGVLDIANTKINGVESNLILEEDQIPIFGGVANG
jgi:uncharacterized phage protein gp47/JayE